MLIADLASFVASVIGPAQSLEIIAAAAAVVC
jgi:hypothetical protein